MIESWNQWTSFVNESMRDDLLLHIVPLHDGVHSAQNSPSILFIRNLRSKKTYWYAFDHPDVKTPQPVEHRQIIEGIGLMGGTKWAVDKKSFTHMVPIKGTYDVGFVSYLNDNKVFELNDFETTAHVLIRRNFPGKPGYGKFVPFTKHLESFTEIAESCEKILKKAKIDEAFKKFNECIIEPLTETEKYGLAVDKNTFKEHFGDICINSGRVFTQYNFYTSTGRPSNRFGGVNYAALNKEDGSRKSFVSRFGQEGQLVLIDYSAFHPRIIALLTDYTIPAGTDIYEYLAKLYFQKKDVDETDVANAKQITFRQLYGGVEEKYSHIKYLSHLKDFINTNWSFFNEHGYVETPIFKRKITNKHIQQPKPATVFNYLLQAAEGEISIPILGSVNESLQNMQTKAVLYTYDSILFDVHNDDILHMAAIRDLMSFGGQFPTKLYVGSNYQDMVLLD
jgi:hypothetical protein